MTYPLTDWEATQAAEAREMEAAQAATRAAVLAAWDAGQGLPEIAARFDVEIAWLCAVLDVEAR